MKDKRTNVGYGKGMASTGGSGGMRGGGKTRVPPRKTTDKRVNQLIQARINATPKDQWPRIEQFRGRNISSKSAQRKWKKAQERAADAASEKVWGSPRKSVAPAFPANVAKTAMKGAAIGAGAAVAVKKTSGGKSPGSVRAMEARRYEEKKSTMQRKSPKSAPKPKAPAKGYKRRPPTPGGRSF